MTHYLTREELSFMKFIQLGVDDSKRELEVNYGRRKGHTTSIIQMFNPSSDFLICIRPMHRFFVKQFGCNSVISISSNMRGRRLKCNHLFVDSYSYIMDTEPDVLLEMLSLVITYNFCFKLG